MLRKCSFILLCVFNLLLHARGNAYFPNFFNSYFMGKYQLSPSYIPDGSKFELACNYRSLLGEFKKISAYSASGARIIDKDSGTLRQQIRLSLYNEREGSYIQSPRAYLGYALRQRLGEKIYLHSGVHLGGTGIYYAAPTVTQSSALLPDGAIAAGLTWTGLQIDLSTHQIFNSSKKVLTSPLVLQRYYHLYGSYTANLGLYWKSRTHSLYRILPGISNEWLMSTSVIYNDLFTFGASFKYGSTLSFHTAFDWERLSDHLQIYLTYNSALVGNVPAWQNGLEIGLNYSLR